MIALNFVLSNVDDDNVSPTYQAKAGAGGAGQQLNWKYDLFLS